VIWYRRFGGTCRLNLQDEIVM